MSYMKIDVETLNSLITLENATRNVILLPFCLVELPNGDFKYFILAKHTITDYISQFGGTLKAGDNFPEFLTKNISNNTRNIINITDFSSSIFYASLEENSEGAISLSNNKPIISFVFWSSSDQDGIHKLSGLNNIIDEYIVNTKKLIKNEPFSEDFEENLVYLTETELFFLCRNEEYLLENDSGDETFSFQVSDGMLFRKDLIELYSPKDGDIPIQKFTNSDEIINHPFASVIFSKISSYIGDSVMNIFDNFEHPFLKTEHDD